MKKTVEEKFIVFYDDDADGFGGAWAAHKKFGRRAKYIPIIVRDGAAPITARGKNIYFIDSLYSQSAVKKLIRDNNVVIIDHHKSRREFIKSAQEWVYGVNHSACVLAWKYFFPSRKTPALLRYVETMDLWTWNLPRAREITAALDSYPRNFKVWNRLSGLLETPAKRKEVVRQGTVLIRHEEKILHNLLESYAELIEFENCRVLALNTPIFSSRVANELARKRPPFGVVWYRKNDVWKISLRSIGRFDVSKIAEKYGGGGHRNAAGFQVSRGRNLPWKFIKNNK